MKKLSILLLGMIITFFAFPSEIQALCVADFTLVLDKQVARMETIQEKVEWLQSLSDSLATPRYTKSKDAGVYKRLREYVQNMLRVFEYELKEEQVANYSKNQVASDKTTFQSNSKPALKLPRLSDNFSNINEQKVREAILSRHNEERNNVGVNSYVYSLDLEGSATTWTNKLAKSGKISNLHLRNDGDGYYNYNSILDRFSGLGITFGKTPKGASSFSETIGYGYYKCSKSDCTQDLIDAVKKTWTNLIMKEKSYNGDHYRAAVMKHFTQMGAGITIDKENNRYYLVIHYGVDFKKSF